ncbi:hypothetical protein ACOMHN_013953 [Nucella lapillus]
MQDDRESQQLPPWNTYLYKLQQEAPQPFCVACLREVPSKPEFYGNEFHGGISRSAADSLLAHDGYYLVRKSERAPDAFTLAIRFNEETKNFKLYFDGQHFVGEKRFDTVYDLVADGLIHFYIELRAADYIKQLSSESTYEESPYMAYNQCRLRHDKTLRVRPTGTYKRQGLSPDVTDAGSDRGDTVNSTPEDDEPEQNIDWTQYEKPHVFKVQNFNGLNWCELCANFMWGLIAQGVKCQDCGVQTHKKCSERNMKRLYGVYHGCCCCVDTDCCKMFIMVVVVVLTQTAAMQAHKKCSERNMKRLYGVYHGCCCCVDTDYCGVQTHKKCSERMPNECMPNMKYVKRLYGADLTTVTKANKQTLPSVVDKCIKEIEKRGVEAEGLYRLAGFHDDVEAIRVSFDKDGESTDIGTGKYEDINTIASALKLYFRLLPIPLITFDVYKPLLDTIKKDNLSEAEMVKQMKDILSGLPPAHFHTLKYLTTHLAKVIEHRGKNMMSAENLSIVFAPTLMRPLETNPVVSLMAAKFEQRVIECILNHQRDMLGR